MNRMFSLMPSVLALSLLACAVLGVTATRAQTASNLGSFSVVPFRYDPDHSFELASGWIQGLGVAPDLVTVPTDTNDPKNKGLVLGADGLSSAGFAGAGGASLVGLPVNLTVNEVGYDLRNGSNCGGGNPRFDIYLPNGCYYFIVCNYPAPTTSPTGQSSWIRYRWDPSGDAPAESTSPSGSACTNLADTDQVSAIRIIFDAGSDGFAILDNIDVNGVLVGH